MKEAMLSRLINSHDIFGNVPRIGGGLPGALCGERVARRGGNYNNTSNAGLAYLNCNNPRSNANVNYGGRPRSRSSLIVRHVTHDRQHGNGRGALTVGPCFGSRMKILTCMFSQKTRVRNRHEAPGRA